MDRGPAPAPRTRTPTPESTPTVDPRLAIALGRPLHGDSAPRRTGRALRRLTSSAAREVAEESRIAREVQQPVTTGRVIAVTSIRGGVGKTTVSALLSRTFHHYRHDPVLALEADAALGTLPVRLGAESVRWSCADLARILTPAMQLTDVTGYLVPVPDGGWLLPASQGRVGAPLDVPTYRTVTLALRRYFAVTVADCETLPGEVARTAMDTAHARIVVAPMTVEGVNGTRLVLDWLSRLPHSALATTVVALTANSPDMTLDLKTAAAHLRETGVAVVPVAYDRHLAQGGPIRGAHLGKAARDAAVRLAAEAMHRAVRVR
ncbi:type VII secretion protein [Streptomyces silvensis]|uniref:Type VII secretion protein n=1 Tax=Streptomyces silvensis TaxID=1765722 RepID=A0A0W7WR37_9ACTN|nr:type VII secretion protein [Streptomyces silvensis]KUF13013.1 type VII secretion protein [Streptomyces silvensis]